jgi:hypothetical protein
LVFCINHEVAAFARARDATRTMFPSTYPHHQFRTATSEELASVATW